MTHTPSAAKKPRLALEQLERRETPAVADLAVTQTDDFGSTLFAVGAGAPGHVKVFVG